MKELSLNILDIAQNSIKAGADTISVILTETADTLTVCISDNGCGMKPAFLEAVTNPFITTRTTRKVGLGIPLFKLAAEQTQGSLTITSKHESEFPADHGTVVTATFHTQHMDFTPLGDIASTLTILIQGNPHLHWIYTHSTPWGDVSLDTDELKTVLGDVPLDTFEVIAWIGEYINEQYSVLKK